MRAVEVSHGRRRVLHALSLDVRPGELLVVVGPSGSGKTTMLRAAAGLEPVDSGRVLLDGDDI
ncbi:MAG: ATP-binding cassette domain-containing protein, partial [Actinobacteria bacterium]|nr:ATP-binding cassette domain-containing protein [Actinomycetota bacterium]